MFKITKELKKKQHLQVTEIISKEAFLVQLQIQFKMKHISNICLKTDDLLYSTG